MTINNPAPFVDVTYILRDPQIDRPWDIQAILSRVTLVDCGAVTVKIVDTNNSASPDTNTSASPDTVIFDDDRSVGALNFKSLYSEDVFYKGSHPIQYIVYHTLYDMNKVMSYTFTVKILDPCEAPKSVTSKVLDD